MVDGNKYKEGEIEYGKADVAAAPVKLLNFRLNEDNSSWGVESKNFINTYLNPRRDDVILDFGAGVCVLSEYIA